VLVNAGKQQSLSFEEEEATCGLKNTDAARAGKSATHNRGADTISLPPREK